MKNLYKESQPFNLILFILIPTAILIVIASIFELGTKPIPLGVGIPLALTFLLLCVPFYKLDIVITDTQAIVQFGTGLFKRSIPINNLDLSTAKSIQLPWYWGIGYRITPQGTLFSTKTGDGLYINSKDKSTEFFISTKNSTQILEAIKKAQATSST